MTLTTVSLIKRSDLGQPLPVEIHENMTIREYFAWIKGNMDQGLIVAASQEPLTEDNSRVLHDFDQQIDYGFAPKANACVYRTASGKERRVHANRLFYRNTYDQLVDSGLIRAQAPSDVNKFHRWLIKISVPGKNQSIFNLMEIEEQIDHPLFKPYYGRMSETLRLVGKSGKKYVTAATERVMIGSRIKEVELHLTKWIQNPLDDEEDPKSIGFVKVDVYNYIYWPDGAALAPKELDLIAGKVLTAKEGGMSPVIHCLMGKGRTGSLVAAVILKEAIEKKDLNRIDITPQNYKSVICKLIVSLRDNGGGDNFVFTHTQLAGLFNYAERLLKLPEIKYDTKV